MDIPVYLVAGFLDSGKTNFINGVLEDGFARQDKTLLLRCEEGEEAYNPRALDNVIVVDIGDEADLTCSRMKELEKKHRPSRSSLNTMVCGRWSAYTGRSSPPTGCFIRS